MFALYQGDTFIDLGTKEYLANKLNVKIGTIEFYMSPTYRKRTNDNGYIVIRIEDD
ncbi:hypothetical protein M4D76_27645 [Peribacillus frigoritolerans]|uniref:hypothetical protein n=1 Tax=Peribacillus frigoritolerans TaxID=450367 RepID=UPI0021A61810|nr:hypothetical protein [Peribacillus frigoritolerans]MCT1392022.1 hypothetical protein [Peribacillus frigoritolerans]